MQTAPMDLPLPEDLATACIAADLRVLACPFQELGAWLFDHYLLVQAAWPRERQLHTVRQALADMGRPEFAHVPVEPFGVLHHA